MSIPDIAATYFAHLSAGRFAQAAACFAEDGFYSHPAYDPGSAGETGRRLEARGRAEIERLFVLRGERDWRHRLRAEEIGSRFYVEGVVRTSAGDPVLSYLSVGELGDDGLIKRYVAYDTRPPVGGPDPA